MANPEKDPRLYMTFPIDTHRHPKVRRLPPEAKWAFFEMNGEARIANNDGVFSAEDAEFEWGREVLEALVRSHPTRPLVLREGDSYVIREYPKHQVTSAELEKRASERSERGRKAAQARWGAARPSMQDASGEHAKSMPDDAEACLQSQSQSQSQNYSPLSVSQVSNARESDETDDEEAVESVKRLAAGAKVDLEVVRSQASRLDREIGARQAYRLAMFLLGKSKRVVSNPMGYIATAFKNDPFEIQQWIDREGAP